MGNFDLVLHTNTSNGFDLIRSSTQDSARCGSKRHSYPVTEKCEKKPGDSLPTLLPFPFLFFFFPLFLFKITTLWISVKLQVDCNTDGSECTLHTTARSQLHHQTKASSILPPHRKESACSCRSQSATLLRAWTATAQLERAQPH